MQGGQREALLGSRGPLADVAMLCMCVAADAHGCVWSHVRAAGACLFRMLQWAVVAGSPSYGTGEAVCTVLRVCWLEMGPRVRVEIPKSGIVSVSPCVGYTSATVES